jgi:outer membrane protein assembly factor BamB
MPALIARSQKDGSVTWQQAFTSAGAQAPVLAAGMVIVAHDSTTISAYDQATGKKKWDAMVANAQAYSSPLTFSGGCNNDSVPTVMNPRTTIAAALASQTLVVAGADVIHVLKLETGKEQWSGAPATTMPPYRDPVIVGDTAYVMDQTGLVQLESK